MVHQGDNFSLRRGETASLNNSNTLLPLVGLYEKIHDIEAVVVIAVAVAVAVDVAVAVAVAVVVVVVVVVKYVKAYSALFLLNLITTGFSFDTLNLFSLKLKTLK
uniref:Uncharacterized protein n=1 Tax=Glossina brevipalpis TaxID=37001 RepID=A0A1A9WUE5_9MUSC